MWAHSALKLQKGTGRAAEPGHKAELKAGKAAERLGRMMAEQKGFAAARAVILDGVS